MKDEEKHDHGEDADDGDQNKNKLVFACLSQSVFVDYFLRNALLMVSSALIRVRDHMGLGGCV